MKNKFLGILPYINMEEFNKLRKMNYNLKDYEQCSRFLTKVISIVHLKVDDSIQIYNNVNHCYETLSQWKNPSIYKYILNQCGFDWRLKDENETLGAFYRDNTTCIDEFNADNKLNLQNGVLNLDDMSFNEHSPKNDKFNYCVSYKYDPEANCPEFQKFLNETFEKDQEIIDVVQEMIGYVVSNKTGAQVAFILFGFGCNGKSVLASIIHSVIGVEQTCALSMDALNGTFGMSDTIGKRANIASENERLASSERIKSLITCDKINIPVKYKNDWSGRLFCRHIFLMNSLPATPDVTPGFMRRFVIIPFNHTVKAKDIDRDLTKKLNKELPGILNWALEGYKRLCKNDFVFSQSKAINEIKKNYMDRENPTAVFFNEVYEAKPGKKVQKSLMYPDFCDWCSKNDLTPITRNKFFTALKFKAEEENSGIELNFKKVNGIYYLFDYQRIKDNSVQGVLQL